MKLSPRKHEQCADISLSAAESLLAEAFNLMEENNKWRKSMAKAARGLGKGLDSLIPASVPKAEPVQETEAKEDNAQGTYVKITKVEPNREQPRKNFDEDALQELADSIKQYGIVEPLIVQDRKTYYEIIAGERRWRAAKLAGLKEVPVIVRNYTEQEIVEISLIENIQREDLNPIEEAQAYRRLLTEFNLKQDEVAERVSKSRTAVTNSMRLLKLCDEVQQMIIDDMITTGHARALISIDDPEQQYTIAQKVFDEKLSVRDVEKLVKNLNKPEKVKKEPVTDKALEAVYQDLEEKLKQSLGTKVSIASKGDGAGKLEIEFYTHDDLEKITDLLTGK
jgi:ParB family chromosome partitioning protein